MFRQRDGKVPQMSYQPLTLKTMISLLLKSNYFNETVREKKDFTSVFILKYLDVKVWNVRSCCSLGHPKPPVCFPRYQSSQVHLLSFYKLSNPRFEKRTKHVISHKSRKQQVCFLNILSREIMLYLFWWYKLEFFRDIAALHNRSSEIH